MNFSDDNQHRLFVGHSMLKNLKGLGCVVAAALFLVGCASTEMKKDDMEKSAEKMEEKAEKEMIGEGETKPATVTLDSMNKVKRPPATVTLSAMNPAEKKEEKPKAPAPPEILDDQYTVIEGQNLWAISALREIYDDAFLWPLIYKRNIDTIDDPDLIYPGQELMIERDNAAEALDAAAAHARTRGAWSVGPLEDADKAYTESQSQ